MFPDHNIIPLITTAGLPRLYFFSKSVGTGALAGATVGAVIGIGAFPLSITLEVAFAEIDAETLSPTGVIAAGLILTLLSIYLGLRSMKEDSRDIWIRHLAFDFTAIG